jgi:hypothetical protein
MPQLRGDSYYLVLQRSSEDFSTATIAICKTFQEAAKGWREGSRISPIFALEDATPPDLAKRPRSWALFFGPVAPGLLDTVPTPHTFLTLGLYNLVAFSTTPGQRDKARELCQRLGVRFEEWELKHDEVIDAEVSTEPAVADIPRPAPETSLPAGGVALRAPAEEYVLGLASAVGKARVFAPTFVPELLSFDRAFRTLLSKDPPSAVSDTHKLLALGNTALARHISQTFGGTSPILHTECYFASHSLLGIGTASLALLRLRQFFDQVLARARIIERFNRLRNVGAHRADLPSLRVGPDFWEKNHLLCYPAQSTIPSLNEAPSDDLLPLLTCFGDREGFVLTQVSLGAPLELVANCNQAQWTPVTLTHEYSHSIIEGFLGALCPDLRTDTEVEETVQMMASDTYPSLFHQLRGLFCAAVWDMSGNAEQHVEAEELADLLERHLRSVNEILTHCFDFMYFYDRDATAYVEAVWISWGAIPNIRARIDDYLTRSLCALHTSNVKSANGETLTCGELEANLRRTLGNFPSAPYVQEAIDQLTSNREEYTKRLTARTQLVRLARYVLFSEDINRRLWATSHATGPARDRALTNPLSFTEEPLENPLKFLAVVARDRSYNQQRAAAILTQLAFATTPP